MMCPNRLPIALMSDRSGAFLSSASTGPVNDAASTDSGCDASKREPGSAKLDNDDNDRTAVGEKIKCRTVDVEADDADDEEINAAATDGELFFVVEDETTARTVRRAIEERIILTDFCVVRFVFVGDSLLEDACVYRLVAVGWCLKHLVFKRV